MPTYDYRCERTGEMFELWQSFSDDSLTVCPQTHNDDTTPCGAAVKKVFSKVGISFKGDGFYKNDHGSSAKSTSASDSANSASRDTKSESSATSDTTSSDSSSSSDSSPSSTASSAPSSSGPAKTSSSDS